LLARERRLRVLGVDDHAVGGDLLAARLQLRALLDRDQALTALRDDLETGVVTERADVVAEHARGIEHVRALRYGDLLAVDGQRDRIGRRRRSSIYCLRHLSHSPPIMLIMP